MITNLELKIMSLSELYEVKRKVEKLIEETEAKKCPECGCFSGHYSDCVTVE